jgi:hypothetical protein
MTSKEMNGFLLHQAASTLGVMVLSAVSWYSAVELLSLVRVNLTTQTGDSVLFGVPGFPFQGAAGLFLGAGLARRVQVKSVVFVWILPLFWFCFGALAVAPSSTLAYLIGEGCRPTRGCFYQVAFTLPLVASILYTIGGAASRRFSRRRSRRGNSQIKANHA